MIRPMPATDGDIEIYFAEDECGPLFLEARRQLKRLAQITYVAATRPDRPRGCQYADPGPGYRPLVLAW